MSPSVHESGAVGRALVAPFATAPPGRRSRRVFDRRLNEAAFGFSETPL
jgi:hypothetical protein